MTEACRTSVPSVCNLFIAGAVGSFVAVQVCFHPAFVSTVLPSVI